MDRAQGATQGFLPQNLRGTHTSSAESSGRRYVAAALLGDGHAAWHLATSAEAVDRGLVMGSSAEICFLTYIGEQYHSLKPITNPQSTASGSALGGQRLYVHGEGFATNFANGQHNCAPLPPPPLPSRKAATRPWRFPLPAANRFCVRRSHERARRSAVGPA